MGSQLASPAGREGSTSGSLQEQETRLNREEGLTIALVEQNAHKALSVASIAYVLQGGTIALQGTAQYLAKSSVAQELYLAG